MKDENDLVEEISINLSSKSLEFLMDLLQKESNKFKNGLGDQLLPPEGWEAYEKIEGKIKVI